MAGTVKIFKIGRQTVKRLVMAVLVFAAVLSTGVIAYEFKFAGNTGKDGVYKICNGYLELEYSAQQNTFEIINLSNGRVYRTEPLNSCDTLDVALTGSKGMEIRQRYKSNYGGLELVAEITLDNERIKFCLKAGSDALLPAPFAFPGAICGEEQVQYFVIPYAEGIYVPADEECAFGDFEMWGHKSTMPFTGMTDSNTGIMLTSDSPSDTAVSFVRAASPDRRGNLLMKLVHYPAKGKFGYDRVFYIDVIENNGYNEMAGRFRRHLENRQKHKKPGEPDYIMTLRDKLRNNGKVDKLIGAVDFWLGTMDMKNKAVIDDLAANGVKKAIINFQYGWKVYDNEKRPGVVMYAAEKGMLPSRYDNYSDIFEPGVRSISKRYRTEGFEERVIIKEDGSCQEGYDSYSNGKQVKGYRLNTRFSAEDAEAYLKKDLKENKYLGRFVDVAVSCRLYEDYSIEHPMLRVEDMRNRIELLGKISSGFGMITGTEETSYWAIPVSHYSEGTMTIAAPEGAGEDWSTPTDKPGSLYTRYTVNPAVRIPLKSLVYHDCHVSGWYTGDGISKVMDCWRTKELLTVLYGAMSLVFPCSNEFWEEHMCEYLRHIKITGWVFEKVGYKKMLSHEFLSGDKLVQKTRFSDGIDVIANFSDSAFCYDRTSVPPEDFIVIIGNRVYTSDWIAGSGR